MKDSDNISILLVSPHSPGNVGATARAMKNMGLRRLRLVDPCDPMAPESLSFAVDAADLLREAEVYETFEGAVADVQLVFGTTSARGRRMRAPLLDVREAGSRIRALAENQRLCVAFGPERSGLTEAQLARCQYLINIPTSPELPTLNLAQAVLIVAYEIFTCTGVEPDPDLGLADQSSLDRMFSHIESTLIRIGFLSTSNPGHIMRSIRRFLARADLTPRDVRILRGIMRQMDWYVRRGRKLDSGRVRKP
ncbi:MAG: RNA methyltransferase [Acidobacteriota bacterium]